MQSNKGAHLLGRVASHTSIKCPDEKPQMKRHRRVWEELKPRDDLTLGTLHGHLPLESCLRRDLEVPSSVELAT